MIQADLFPRPLPRGLVYQAGFLTADEEQELLSAIAGLPLAHARYRQFTARRRTINYGSVYDFQHQQSRPAAPIPEFLSPLRAKIAAWAGVSPGDFAQALIAEYRPGTPLGWHRDVPDFEIVTGISLGGAARIRFRPHPWAAAQAKDVFALQLEPRSAYILRDEARWRWQHSIPPTRELRYSITLRTRRDRGTPRAEGR